MAEPGGTVRRLVSWLRRYRLRLVAGVLAAAAASVLDGATLLFLIPLFRHLFGTTGGLSSGIEGMVDRLLAPWLSGATATDITLRLGVLLWGVLLAKNLLAYLAGQLSVQVQEGLVRDLRAALFAHLLRLDLDWLERTRGGQVIARVMHDADQTRGVVSAALASFFQNLVLIASMLVVLTQLSWRLTLLTLAAAPALVLGIRSLLRRLRRHARARAHEAGEMTAALAERVAAVKLIRTYGGEAAESAAFHERADRYRRQVLRTHRFAALSGPVSEVFGGLLLVVLIAAGSSPVFTGGGLAPQALVVFLVAALRVMAPLKAISQFPALMAQALAGAERVFEILALPPVELEPPGLPAARFSQDLVFEDVWFRYPAGPREAAGEPAWALREISFRLPRGAVVAVVGPSGAGKSTLADLLPRLREPSRGRLLLDGQPLTGVSRASLRGLIGYVGQETVLFNDTVLANIAYGRPGVGPAAVEAAAEAAHADDFIRRLPQGYHTVLGERGTRLSGGQRQRIAIARAILRDPPILILDEATSALDRSSERLVQDALLHLMRDRTVLVIAHRLATVRHADLILVLDHGRIVEQGTHDRLMAQDGLYRRLAAGPLGLGALHDAAATPLS